MRVSLEEWTNEEIKTKTRAEAIFDDLKNAVRAGAFDKRSVEPPREAAPLTFRQFAEVYKERHVFAKGLAIGRTIDYRLPPIVDRFADKLLPRSSRRASEASWSGYGSTQTANRSRVRLSSSATKPASQSAASGRRG